jgi:hypothetical protein
VIGSYVSLISQLTFHCNVHSKIVGFGVLEESLLRVVIGIWLFGCRQRRRRLFHLLLRSHLVAQMKAWDLRKGEE